LPPASIERHGSRALHGRYGVGDYVVVCALLANDGQSTVAIGAENQTSPGVECGGVRTFTDLECGHLLAVRRVGHRHHLASQTENSRCRDLSIASPLGLAQPGNGQVALTVNSRLSITTIWPGSLSIFT
jgi:hypothetical protein